MDGTASQDKNKNRQQEPSQEQDKPKRRRGSVTHLHNTWFVWYAQEPRMWQSSISKKQKSDAKQLVVFMKLFLEDGFTLDNTAPDYRDRVLDLGKRVAECLLAFLAGCKITSRGSGAVLKHLRTLHRSGVLNGHIERHQRLLQTAAIKVPAPEYTQDVLEVISQTEIHIANKYTTLPPES